MNRNELIERLADQEHERWSGWMKHMFDNWVPENINRWKNQMVTPYAELPEHSKESDRKEARETMRIVGPLLAQLEAKNERLRFRECSVCGRQITVLHEISSHMTSGKPCPGSGTLVEVLGGE